MHSERKVKPRKRADFFKPPSHFVEVVFSPSTRREMPFATEAVVYYLRPVKSSEESAVNDAISE